ncbi:MAG: hypothetical protein ACXVLQ_15895 [Bacteriovorax sp.]
MSIERIISNDPKEHAQNIEKHIIELKNHCLEDCNLIEDPKARALFETAADVLEGLEKAFSDFQSENEGGWINDPNRPTLQ